MPKGRTSFAVDLDQPEPILRDELDELFMSPSIAPMSTITVDEDSGPMTEAVPTTEGRESAEAMTARTISTIEPPPPTPAAPTARADSGRPSLDDVYPDQLSGYLPPDVEQALHMAAFMAERTKSDVVTEALSQLIAELQSLQDTDPAAFQEELTFINRFDRGSRPVQRLYTVTRGIATILTQWAGLYRVPRSAVLRASIERYLGRDGQM